MKPLLLIIFTLIAISGCTFKFTEIEDRSSISAPAQAFKARGVELKTIAPLEEDIATQAFQKTITDLGVE